MSTPLNNALSWPAGAPVLPLASLRPVLDRLASLVTRHAADAEQIPGLAVTEDEVSADPPPALEQLADELGGIRLRGLTVLTLLVEDRTDVGPYTLLGEPTSFYPLYETPEAAVVLTLDADGVPGAVYGIGEDLALQLAAPDLPAYLDRFAEALEATLTALAARGPAEDDDEGARTDAAEELMDRHLFAAVLGLDEPDEEAAVAVQDPADADLEGLPEGTIAVADLRTAPVGARVDLMEVDVPGDPLELRVAWREGGRVVALRQG